MDGMMSWRMGEQGWRKGPWTPAEDKLLIEYVELHGEGRWSSVAGCSGLKRSGKSCRLRWVNYLRPGLKKGHLTPQEEGIIIELHSLWGNKWSTIARYLPGRTDNEIKNYWRTHFKTNKKPSQNQNKRKLEASFRQNQHQEVNKNMNTITLPHEEANNGGMITKSPQETTSEPQGQNQYVMGQDFASWLDTLSEDRLWGRFVWNLDHDHDPYMEQSFSSLF